MDVALNLALLFVPIGCFLFALRWTLALRSDDPAVIPFDGVKSGPRSTLLALTAFGGFAIGMVLHRQAGYVLMISAGLLCAASAIAAQAHHQRAARGLIAQILTNYLIMFLWFGFFWLDGPTSSNLLGAAFCCLGLALLIWLTRFQRNAGLTKRLSRTSPIVFTALLVIALVATVNRFTYASPGRLQSYVEDFDEPVGELLRWEEMGRAASWLSGRSVDVDTSGSRRILAKALAAGIDVHPSTLKGAIAAGVVGPEEYGLVLATMGEYGRKRLLRDRPEGYGWTLSTPVELATLIEVGELTPAERSQVAENLARSWPGERGLGNLQDAREICEVLTRLGRPDLIKARRPAIHALLERSWCDEAAWFSRPGGFSVYDTAEDDRTTDDEANLDALDLMRYVGAPAWFEPARLEHNAQAGLRPHLLLHGFALWSHDILHIVAVNRVCLEYDATPAWDLRLADWSLALALLLPLIFVVVVIRRAPDVPVHEETWKEHIAPVDSALE